MYRKMSLLVVLVVATLSFVQCSGSQKQGHSSGFQQLDEWTEVWKEGQQTYFGYPINQNSALREFYEWYLGSGMYGVNLNNAGDPMNGQPWKMSSSTFEGLFLCTKETYDSQDNFRVTYLNGNMKMINCSRDAVQPLKFWWMIQKVGFEQWSQQANQMMECTSYLKSELDKTGWPCWSNEYSNTVFFKRPSQDICDEYVLALGYDERFGGELAHVVVMQHVTKGKIDQLFPR